MNDFSKLPLSQPSLAPPASGVRSQRQYVDNFTDLNSLDAVKKMGREGDQQSLREVARQFEAMFVQQLLKTMRATEDVFAEGNYTQSSEMKFHRDLLDQQLSLSMTKDKGLGLAEALFEQMRDQYGKLLPPVQTAAAKSPTAPRDKPVLPASRDVTVDRATSVASISVATEPAPSVLQKAEHFVDQVFDYAQSAADKLGVAVEGLIAQAALETGWGEHVLKDSQGNSSFNVFNIKADHRWDGASLAKRVLEYDEGRPVNVASRFRQYDNLATAFEDFTRFLSASDRYQDSLHSDSVQHYATALQQGGYATDPAYADKIVRIAESPLLKSILAQKLL